MDTDTLVMQWSLEMSGISFSPLSACVMFFFFKSYDFSHLSQPSPVRLTSSPARTDDAYLEPGPVTGRMTVGMLLMKYHAVSHTRLFSSYPFIHPVSDCNLCCSFWS